MKWRAGLIAAAIGLALAPVSPSTVERWYSTGAYPFFQPLLTSTSNLVPFALFDVLLVGAFAWCVWTIVRAIAEGRRRGQWSRAALRLGVNLLGAAAAIYIAFLAVWGLNYRRLPLKDRLRFDAGRISPDAARDLALTTVIEVNALHDRAHGDAMYEASAAAERDGPLVDAFARVEQSLGVGPASVGRAKRSVLDPYFRSAAVDGMTDPFFLETLVVSDLLPFERPFVVAHEWSHLAGFADESEANFVGWLTAIHGSPAAQYSGWLFLYDEVAGGLAADDRARITARLGPGPREDLRAMSARARRDVMPALSAAGWRAYDRYLKANRVEAGVTSYAEVVQLILGTRFDADWRPLMSP